MKHPDHVNILKPASPPPGGTWADFGAGSGAFTLALRELVGPEALIYAVDKDRGSLRELEQAYRQRFGDTSKLHLIDADIARPLDLPALDGVLMANSLHYFKDSSTAKSPRGRHVSPSGNAPLAPPSGDLANSASWRSSRAEDKLSLLLRLRSYLKPNGALLLVEYNADSGNMWVPHPLSFSTWRDLAARAGFTEPRLLATHPSNFLREFYSALCNRKDN